MKEARNQGLKAPVLLMGKCGPTLKTYVNQKLSAHTSPSGYYNPMLAYGEERAIQDAAEAGANGFIMVDLPPEEAIGFREKCLKAK